MVIPYKFRPPIFKSSCYLYYFLFDKCDKKLGCQNLPLYRKTEKSTATLHCCTLCNDSVQ